MAGTLSAAPERVKYGESLRDIEPELLSTRPIITIGNVAAEEIPMLAFELVGLALVALFLGALVTGKRNVIGR